MNRCRECGKPMVDGYRFCGQACAAEQSWCDYIRWLLGRATRRGRGENDPLVPQR